MRPTVSTVLRRHPLRGNGCADQVVATVGGIVEINLIALTNGAARKKQVVETDIPGMAAYGPCIRVGEFLSPSGLMAIGRDGQIPRSGHRH